MFAGNQHNGWTTPSGAGQGDTGLTGSLHVNASCRTVVRMADDVELLLLSSAPHEGTSTTLECGSCQYT